MEVTVSITPKWQIHIPVAVRKKLKLVKPSQVSMKVNGGLIVIKPKESKILKMGGSLAGIKPTKPINITKIRDYIDYSNW